MVVREVLLTGTIDFIFSPNFVWHFTETVLCFYRGRGMILHK